VKGLSASKVTGPLLTFAYSFANLCADREAVLTFFIGGTSSNKRIQRRSTLLAKEIGKGLSGGATPKKFGANMLRISSDN
jgi:hypothetical protein